MKNIIYYFSGTGNCMHAAQEIAKALGNSKIIRMENSNLLIPTEKAASIGFIFPVHY